jgi:hypothetical protein
MGRKLRKPIRLAFVVGDIHCGSQVGLCPPDYATFDGSTYGLNPIQEWMWPHWKDMTGPWLRKMTGGEPFLFVVNGDSTEGIHHKNMQVVHADPGVHAKIAIDCLKPVAALAAATYMVRGTECHVGFTGESNIGSAIGAERNEDSGERSSFEWYVRINGTLCSFKHHISASARIGLYATQLGVAIAEEQACAARAGHPIPKVICRAHRHTLGVYHDADAMCITTPPWQLKTTYGHAVVPAPRPHVGGVLLDFRDKEPGDLPTVHCFKRTVKPAKEAVHG